MVNFFWDLGTFELNLGFLKKISFLLYQGNKSIIYHVDATISSLFQYTDNK